MENTRFDYLRKIGVDVWTLRENVANFQQPQEPAQNAVDNKSNQEIPQDLPETTKSVPAGSTVSTPEGALDTGAAAGLPALRAIAAQLRSAEGLPAIASANEGSTPKSVSKDESPLVAQKNKSSNAEANLPPEFLFCFLDYIPENGTGVTLVFSLPHETQSLPGEVRQFSDDVARSLLGGLIRPNIGELRWPMVKSAHISQTELEAKAVVADKVSRCQRNLILFGETSQHYVIGRSSHDAEAHLAPVSLTEKSIEKSTEKSIEQEIDRTLEKVGEKQVFRALSHLDYCSVDKSLGGDTVKRKRALWQLIRKVQKAL